MDANYSCLWDSFNCSGCVAVCDGHHLHCLHQKAQQVSTGNFGTQRSCDISMHSCNFVHAQCVQTACLSAVAVDVVL